MRRFLIAADDRDLEALPPRLLTRPHMDRAGVRSQPTSVPPSAGPTGILQGTEELRLLSGAWARAIETRFTSEEALFAPRTPQACLAKVSGSAVGGDEELALLSKEADAGCLLQLPRCRTLTF